MTSCFSSSVFLSGPPSGTSTFASDAFHGAACIALNGRFGHSRHSRAGGNPEHAGSALADAARRTTCVRRNGPYLNLDRRAKQDFGAASRHARGCDDLRDSRTARGQKMWLTAPAARFGKTSSFPEQKTMRRLPSFSGSLTGQFFSIGSIKDSFSRVAVC